MISVDEALQRIVSLTTVKGTESVRLENGLGRILAEEARASRDQPPFDASSMDGYAVVDEDAIPGKSLTVIGTVPAGSSYCGQAVRAGETVRIFTGAPLPTGTSRVIMQEDVEPASNGVVIGKQLSASRFVRPRGSDYREGFCLTSPRKLNPMNLSLLASMNVAELVVRKKPEIAILPTGDELKMPGEQLSDCQICASNVFGLKAIIEAVGGTARILPIAGDSDQLLRSAFELAADADILVTVGGASVGDHDLVQSTAIELGYELSFYKIRMRPGKPLLAGRKQNTVLVGVPGNPVSALICGFVFLIPAVRAMLGLPPKKEIRSTGELSHSISANGDREHYMRACTNLVGGISKVTIESNQDSSLLSVFASSNALVVRPPNDPPRSKGEQVEFICMDQFFL